MNYLNLTESIEVDNKVTTWTFILTVSGSEIERKLAEHIMKHFLERNCNHSVKKWNPLFLVGDETSDAFTYKFHAVTEQEKDVTCVEIRDHFHVALLSTYSKEGWRLVEHVRDFPRRWLFERNVGT